MTNVVLSCWPGWRALEPFDLGMGTAIRETTTDPLLAQAWDEAIVSEREDRSIGYWKERLAAKEAKGAAEARPGIIVNGKAPENRKRKGTPKTSFPPAYTRDEDMDDDEEANIFLPPAESIGPNIKDEFDGSSFSGLTPLRPGLPLETSKRGKLDIAGRFSVRPTKSEARSRLATPIATSSARSTPSRLTMKNNNIE